MRMRLFAACLLFAVPAFAGCSSEATTTTAQGVQTATTAEQTATTAEQTATTTPADEPTTTTAAAPATISLPDGWTMTDALSADDVGAITGETMTYFPEAASAAQNGKPQGSYLATGKDGSKIRFSADVQGGEGEFEKIKQFAEAGSVEEVSGVGDKAYVCAFSATDHGIVALQGEVVIRIDWNPSVYTADKAEFGPQLAGALLDNIFQ